MEHQGSLFPKAVFCFYCATALVTDCAWYMQKSLLAMVKEKRGRFRGLKEKKRLKNKQTKNQTVMSTHPSNQWRLWGVSHWQYLYLGVVPTFITAALLVGLSALCWFVFAGSNSASWTSRYYGYLKEVSCAYVSVAEVHGSPLWHSHDWLWSCSTKCFSLTVPLYHSHNNNTLKKAILSIVLASALSWPFSCFPSWAAAYETEECDWPLKPLIDVD